ncbi:MAG: sulfurtransferase TusA family protein [Candidatus Thiodiazotropha sp.]
MVSPIQKYDHFVDIKGLCCSAPVIRLTKEFKLMNSGDIVLVESDKVSMLNDIASYCALTKNELIRQEEKDNLYYFWIKVT